MYKYYMKTFKEYVNMHKMLENWPENLPNDMDNDSMTPRPGRVIPGSRVEVKYGVGKGTVFVVEKINGTDAFVSDPDLHDSPVRRLPLAMLKVV